MTFALSYCAKVLLENMYIGNKNEIIATLEFVNRIHACNAQKILQFISSNLFRIKNLSFLPYTLYFTELFNLIQ